MIRYSEFLKHKKKDYNEPELNLLKELNNFGAEFFMFGFIPCKSNPIVTLLSVYCLYYLFDKSSVKAN